MFSDLFPRDTKDVAMNGGAFETVTPPAACVLAPVDCALFFSLFSGCILSLLAVCFVALVFVLYRAGSCVLLVLPVRFFASDCVLCSFFLAQVLLFLTLLALQRSCILTTGLPRSRRTPTMTCYTDCQKTGARECVCKKRVFVCLRVCVRVHAAFP